MQSLPTEASKLQTKKAGTGRKGNTSRRTTILRVQNCEFPRKIKHLEKIKFGSKSCHWLAPSGIQTTMFAVWKWNFRSWLSVFWCQICVDRPHWKLFVCTYVEPPDVFLAHIVKVPWCLAKVLQLAKLFQWI